MAGRSRLPSSLAEALLPEGDEDAANLASPAAYMLVKSPSVKSPAGTPRMGRRPSNRFTASDPMIGRTDQGCAQSLISELPNVIVTTVILMVNSITFGSMLYTGRLQRPGYRELVPDGVITWVVARIAAQLVSVIHSGVPFMQATGTIEMLPLFVCIFQKTSNAMPDSTPEEYVGTCLALVFVSTMSTGLLLTIGSRFGLARILRAAPLVVLKGALFGVGLFLCTSGVMSAKVGGIDDLSADWPFWCTSVSLGLLIYAVDEKTHSPVKVCATIVCIASIPFFANIFGLIDMDDLRQKGWIFEDQRADAQAWYIEYFQAWAINLPHARWDVVLAVSPSIFGVWLTHGLTTLMDLKAIDILTSAEVELGREMEGSGWTNVLAAICGSWPCNYPSSNTLCSFKLGGRNRVGQWGTIAGCFVVAEAAKHVVPYLTAALPACVAFWLGLMFVKETLVDIFKKYSHKTDIAIVAIMGAVMMFVGFVDGLVFGLMLGMADFIWRYSGSPAVLRATGDAAYFRANVHRTEREYEVLQKLGHKVKIVHAEGVLMFGSMPHLVDALQPLLEGSGVSNGHKGSDWVVLNLRGVRRLDYSGAIDILALGKIAAMNCHRLVLTELTPRVLDSLVQTGFSPTVLPRTAFLWEELRQADMSYGLFYTPHYNVALKVCEDVLLAGDPTYLAPIHPNPSIEKELETLRIAVGDSLSHDENAIKDLRTYFERASYKPGQELWKAGDTASFCVAVVSGELFAMQGSEGPDAPFLQEICTTSGWLGHAGALGELTTLHNVYVPADCPEPCTVLKLDFKRFSELKASRPDLAIALLQVFVERVQHELKDLYKIVAHY